MKKLLPFQYRFHPNGQVLLVNECGDYYFLSQRDFDALVHDDLPSDIEVYKNLVSNLIIKDEESYDTYLDKISAKYRSRKAYLKEFTSLHMMVITLRCNQKCEYCQVSCAEEDAHLYDMSIETAYKIVDTIFQTPSNQIKIEFQGGEPTLHWKVVEATVLYAKEKAKEYLDKKVEFVLCTNLIGITEKQLLFCKEHTISVSTSLDGIKAIHDKHRLVRLGGSSYDMFMEKLELAREIVGFDHVNALMTTTAQSLKYLPEIVDEYIKHKFNGIFIRSLNPYGFAAEKAELLSYSMEEFVQGYIEIFKYILSKNKEIFFPEHFTAILLARILTPFSTGFVDLQSPVGAGISGVIYDYDGSVYPTDEARMLARMGDSHFKLGNVYTDSYMSIFGGDKLRNLIANSCVETTPSCAYCVYQAYCGTDPVRNYLESKDEVRDMQNTPFCIKHKAIFDFLLDFIEKCSEEEENILWSWITNTNRTDCNV